MAASDGCVSLGIWKTGYGMWRVKRAAAATVLARATGMKDRGPEFEQEQFDGQENGGDGRAEDGGHSGGGAGGEKRFALDGGGAEQLADQRTERPAGGDDRAFGAERAAGADGDGGRERLEKREPGRARGFG